MKSLLLSWACLVVLGLGVGTLMGVAIHLVLSDEHSLPPAPWRIPE